MALGLVLHMYLHIIDLMSWFNKVDHVLFASLYFCSLRGKDIGCKAVSIVACTIEDKILGKPWNEIVWEPKMKDQSPGKGTVYIRQKYHVPKCDIWFIKFSHYKKGSREENVSLWEMQSSPPV